MSIWFDNTNITNLIERKRDEFSTKANFVKHLTFIRIQNLSKYKSIQIYSIRRIIRLHTFEMPTKYGYVEKLSFQT